MVQSSAKPARRRGPGRPFQKGQSGNPGGRPKAADDVRDLARQYTKDAVERLVRWMQSDNPKASVAACVALLNRGWGLPQQSVDLNAKIGLHEEALAALRALA